MSEQYIEVWDKKKLFLVFGTIVVIILGIIITTTNFSGYVFKLPEIPGIEVSIPDIELPVGQNTVINPNYEKFLEFGLTKEDVLWYQNYSCVDIEFGNGTGLQDSGQFGAIYTQKLTECGLK